MKIVDERGEQYVQLYDKIDRIQREFKTWWENSTIVSIKRKLLWFFHRTEFKVAIVNANTAFIYVMCRKGKYNVGYLTKLGELFEREGFQVTAYLKDDC